MRNFLTSTVLLALVATNPAAGQTLLRGEFGDIEFGRELIGTERLPTIQELRSQLADEQVRSVLMFKLFGDGKNHHVPVWSPGGRRLSLQRSLEDAGSSQLLLFEDLSQASPRLLTNEANVYDYMFRWGLNSESAFVFARIGVGPQTTQIFFSDDGQTLEPRTDAGRRYALPSLYVRNDGVRWMVYEDGDELVHQAWDERQNDRRSLGEGSSPRFNRDGTRILVTRRDDRSGRLGAREVRVLDLRKNSVTVLLSPGAGFVRSPTWSPDERLAAFYHRDAGDFSPWRIEVRPTSGGNGRRLLDGVVVNPDYISEGPSWEPSGRRVWCFSHGHREQEYYPLVAGDVATGDELLVDYPKRVTTPQDLAVNPVTEVPEIAMVAHDGLPRDLFVVFCNHY